MRKILHVADSQLDMLLPQLQPNLLTKDKVQLSRFQGTLILYNTYVLYVINYNVLISFKQNLFG